MLARRSPGFMDQNGADEFGRDVLSVPGEEGSRELSHEFRRRRATLRFAHAMKVAVNRLEHPAATTV